MRHHDLALAAYRARAVSRPEVRGILVTGSVARGTERADSDVDLLVVVTDEAWDEAVATERTMVVEHEDVGYAGGYFDVKLTTAAQLSAVAERGDDPVRASVGESKILLDQGISLEGLLSAIRSAAAVDREARASSYVAQARLHGEYFLQHGIEHDDRFLVAHAAVHLGLAAGRVALALAGRHHPGPKGFLSAVASLPDGGAELAESIRAVAAAPSEERAAALLALVEAAAGHLLPPEATLSRFVEDNELAWFHGTVPPEHW